MKELLVILVMTTTVFLSFFFLFKDVVSPKAHPLEDFIQRLEAMCNAKREFPTNGPAARTHELNGEYRGRTMQVMINPSSMSIKLGRLAGDASLDNATLKELGFTRDKPSGYVAHVPRNLAKRMTGEDMQKHIDIFLEALG